MAEARIKTSVWISAQVRMCSLKTMPAVISHRGDADAGSVVIRLDRLDGTTTVLSQSRDAHGERVWLKATGDEPVANSAADEYIARRVKNDPDIWILDIEDPRAEYEPDAPVVV